MPIWYKLFLTGDFWVLSRGNLAVKQGRGGGSASQLDILPLLVKELMFPWFRGRTLLQSRAVQILQLQAINSIHLLQATKDRPMKVFMAQLNPVVGDISGNLFKLADTLPTAPLTPIWWSFLNFSW